ncbi:MAG: carbamoyltransferase N-terminal domain-containing protein [Bacteroidota bacterium]
MRICGLKLTHDGAVALIEDQRLVFSVEMEKIANNPRYASIEDTEQIVEILALYGYRPEDIDCFVIDGWGGFDQDAVAIQPRLRIGPDTNQLMVDHRGEALELDIAQYREKNVRADVLEERQFSGLRIADRNYDYSSFLHVTGHLFSAYACSPFATAGESSYILVWDGGMYPRLYYFDAQQQRMENLGPIFLFIGNIYSIFSQHFGPFKVKGRFAKDSLSVAGKVMAYIAKGQAREELYSLFEEIYQAHYSAPMGFANVFVNAFKERVGEQYSDEDILCSFHHYLEQLLLRKLRKKIERYPRQHRNLCLAGGCALNIKWNRSIRNTGFFDAVFVPPFPNDSGSAIGAAAAAMLHRTGSAHLDWSVYAGPAIIANQPANHWDAVACTVPELAQLLHESQEPVVFLHGRAEIGPRALGNRSILASPASPRMKAILNYVKKREPYRPVSPICLERCAPEIFQPGSPDPYMLFDHFVRPGWESKIPAICHLDGTARLQTITADRNPLVAELLEAFYQLSGLPMLCNTSANLPQKGFFPDVHSATRWDRVNYVWCDQTLYRRREKIPLHELVSQPEALADSVEI